MKTSSIAAIAAAIFMIAAPFLALLFSASPAAAHYVAVPFLMVNGKPSILYPIAVASSSTGFLLPQHEAPDNYLAGQTINFQIDENFVPLSLYDLDHVQYLWQFGDGTAGTGLKLSHAYARSGSYILTLQLKNTRDYLAPDPSVPFEALLINVVPSKDYQLPVAVLKINGQGVHDPAFDELHFPFDKKLAFEASESSAKSSGIASYYWDFGDGQSSSASVTTHHYNKNERDAYPVLLQVQDKNGFISDTSVVVVDDSPESATSSATPVASQKIDNVTIKTAGDRDPFTVASVQLVTYLKNLSSQALKTGATNYGLMTLMLLVAFFAGSLHALTPGHGKSLMAALLIGKERSKAADVLVITSSITLAHTAVIFALAFLFLVINLRFPVVDLLPSFNRITALLVVTLALTLLYRGYKNWRHQREHEHEHGHEHHHEHGHSHNGTNGSQSRLQLLLAGVSGGVMPCIDALALLMLFISLGQALLGLIVVFVFSLGLACAILSIGMLLMAGKQKLNLEQRFGTLAEVYGPLVAGAFILVVGLRLVLA